MFSALEVDVNMFATCRKDSVFQMVKLFSFLNKTALVTNVILCVLYCAVIIIFMFIS